MLAVPLSHPFLQLPTATRLRPRPSSASLGVVRPVRLRPAPGTHSPDGAHRPPHRLPSPTGTNHGGPPLDLPSAELTPDLSRPAPRSAGRRLVRTIARRPRGP